MVRSVDNVRIAVAACSVVCGLVVGERYVSRLPNHRGYFLVPVEDEVHVVAPPRPRHTVMIVIDGLRRDAAETMASTAALRARGQCRISDQGTYTVSRPVYALLSTGLEVDRTGARNNDLTTPLAAESFWQIARARGLSVAGSSHLPWWKELFPDGFDRFNLPRSHDDDVFAIPEIADVQLVHPLYVDDAGHHFGGASAEYAAAAARADRETTSLLARLDLERDLVLFTADHGHTDAGGHGGADPILRDVLMCVAGPGIVHTNAEAPFDGRVTAPLLSVMLGQRFPRDMRAGDDGLDAIWDMVHLDDAYVADRRAAIAHFREVNQKAIGRWPVFYAHEAKKQLLRMVLPGVVALAFLLRRWKKVPWIAFVTLTTWGLHRLILGPFDYTVVNLRERFLVRAFSIVILSMTAAVVSHALTLRKELARDMLLLTTLLLVANVGHIFVYGWPLGFPLPPAELRYFPFFGAIALFGYAFSATTLLIGEFRAGARARAPH